MRDCKNCLNYNGECTAWECNFVSRKEAKDRMKPTSWIVEDGLRKIYKCEKCGQIVCTDDISVYKFCHGCGKEIKNG